MPQYKDTGDQCPAQSGIRRYQAGYDWIDLTFESGATYTYRAENIGQRYINQMKQLASDGDCLNTWLNQRHEIRRQGTKKLS